MLGLVTRFKLVRRRIAALGRLSQAPRSPPYCPRMCLQSVPPPRFLRNRPRGPGCCGCRGDADQTIDHVLALLMETNACVAELSNSEAATAATVTSHVAQLTMVQKMNEEVARRQVRHRHRPRASTDTDVSVLTSQVLLR